MSDLDCAYLAGLIDGEGTIGVRSRSDGFVNVELGVCMTTPAPLHWAMATTGAGGIYHRPERRLNRRDAYFWKVGQAAQIATILRQIIPYLKVKQAEARLFLVFAHLRSAPRVSGRRNSPEVEAIIARLMSEWKRRPPTYEEALDLCVYLRTALYEQEHPAG